jgi:queuosine precursor transporter
MTDKKPYSPPTYLIVSLYLAAIVASNLVVAHWGQAALIFTAWILIPFDFVARDVLHGRWKGRSLYLRIITLMIVGGAITVAMNTGALWVAIASVLTFSVGVALNTLLYEVWWDKPRLRRMIYSNTAVSLVDSLMFPLLAFGSLSISLSIAQFLSKAAGSFVWASVVNRSNLK